MKIAPYLFRLTQALYGVSLVSVGVATFACAPSYKVMSPAEIEKMGTVQYQQPPGVVFKAAMQALETLGYKVTVSEAEKGKLKTAPKVFFTSAVATGGRYTAVASSTEDGLGWDLSIAANANGSVVMAHPRPYRNGVDVSDQPGMMVQEVVEPHFRTLFREIESNLK